MCFPLRTAALIVALALLIPVNAAAAAQVAEELQKTYANIEAMRADFIQVLKHKESGSIERRKGFLVFKKPLLVRWETTSPSPELLLVGKDAIWNAFPDEELAYKYALGMAEDSRSLIRVITGQARLDQDFDLEEGGMEEGLLAVRLYPKEPVQSLVEALLWLDPKTYVIKKVRVYDFYGNENEIAFSRQEMKAQVRDALFTYNPPAHFEVEDRSKDASAAPQKPLLQ